MSHSASHIKTERLWLREIDESDTATIVRLRSDGEAYKFFKAPHKLTEEEHINWYRGSYLPDVNRIDWIAVDDNNGSVIGLFNVVKKQEAVEVSYLLDKDERGKGYATEAVLAMIDVAVSKWKPKKFVAVIHMCNISSRKFIERLGFQQRSINGEFVCYSYYRKICARKN